MANIAIALAQINVTVGDITGNAQKIRSAYETACAKGAQLVVFPELCLIGYPPEDLVLMPAFRSQAMEVLQELAKQTLGKAAMLVGSVWDNALVTSGEDESIYNAAVLLDEGRIQHIQPKTLLPNYGIFDEKRLFDSEVPEVMEWRGRKLGVMICEDIWSEELALEQKKQGAEILIVLNASPFELGKDEARVLVAQTAVTATKLPLVYVNLVGGQDDIVFDGGSFVLLPFPSPLEGEGGVRGSLALQMKKFEEDLQLFSFRDFAASSHPPNLPPQGVEEYSDLWSAMKLGLVDYVRKNSFKGVLLGLSGGIDSAITAALAVDALGKENVLGVLLPSPYTSKDSTQDALLLAKNLGIETVTIPISPAMETMKETLDRVFPLPNPPPQAGEGIKNWMENVAIGGNLQARLRGVILMALSNQTGKMLLSTGNKSEIAVGYTTLYGDACGGYNVLKDLYKTQIYQLAQWRNQNSISSISSPHPNLLPEGEGIKPSAFGRGLGEGPIPQNSITKAPSAELKPNQKDSDQLPPYDVLDAILEAHIEGRMGLEEIIAEGFDKVTVEKVLKLVRINEYKRRQSCPGVKLSSMLFGKDRRYPLTNGFSS